MLVKPVAAGLATNLVITTDRRTYHLALTSSAVAGVPQEEAGVASALLNSGQQIGASLGLAILTAVSTARTNAIAPAGPPNSPAAVSALVDGWALGFVVAAGFLAGAGIVGGGLVRLRPADVVPEAAPVPA